MGYRNPNYYRDYFRNLGEVRRQYLRDRYHKDPSKQAEASKRYRAKHPDRIRTRNNSPKYKAKRIEWRIRNKERVHEYARKQRLKRLGATLEWYEAQLTKQGHCCAICSSSLIELPPQAVNIDHCHATGRLRGILCNLCNTGLGAFRESPDIFRAALSYLAQTL